jgi:hypothetical protein
MPTTTPSRPVPKVKKSFSISVESEAFIRKACKERKSKSESETLDALLNELREIQQREAIGSAYQDYYDQMSDAEAIEHDTWGTFAQTQIAEQITSE